ncbi:MAG: hypothetical protein L3K18_01345 [Thermoplasmata archaeon]|nr:hypothetical protein [Thermoplasmata archaeon]
MVPVEMQGKSARNADSADSWSRVLRSLAYALLATVAVWTVLVYAGVIGLQLFLDVTLGLLIWAAACGLAARWLA